MGRKPSEDQDKIIIRLPQGMRQRIKVLAEENGRSMTSEIVLRLQRTFDEDASVPDFAAGARVDQLTHDLDALRAEVRQLASKVHASGSKK